MSGYKAKPGECLRCGAVMEDQGDRQLLEHTPLTFLPHSLAVTVLECPGCGHIELFSPKGLRRYVQDQEDAELSEEPISPEASAALLNLGIRFGGEDLPPEGPIQPREPAPDDYPVG